MCKLAAVNEAVRLLAKVAPQLLLTPLLLLAGIQETPHSQRDGWPQDFKIKEGHLRHQGHHRDLLLDGLQRLPIRRAHV